MKVVGIYKITNPSNKVYIGQSIDVLGRQKRYSQNDCKKQIRLYNSINKYGWLRHKFEILCQCDESELNNLEIYYIELYQSFNTKFGLNLRSGGANGRMSDETKRRLSLNHSPKSSGKGRKMSEETKRKISTIRKGIVFSEDTKNKMRLAKIGRKHTPEHISKSAKGRTGKKRSDLFRKKISERSKAKLNQQQINDIRNLKASGVTYRELSDKYKLHPQTLMSIVRKIKAYSE